MKQYLESRADDCAASMKNASLLVLMLSLSAPLLVACVEPGADIEDSEEMGSSGDAEQGGESGGLGGSSAMNGDSSSDADEATGDDEMKPTEPGEPNPMVDPDEPKNPPDETPPMNSAPSASDAAFEFAEGTQLVAALAATDADDDPLQFQIVTQPMHGTISLDGGSFIYTPSAEYVGNDSFEFVANDGMEDSVKATVSLTVLPQIPDQKVEWGDQIKVDLAPYFTDPGEQEFTVEASAGLFVASLDGTQLTLDIEGETYPGHAAETVRVTADDGEQVVQSFRLAIDDCAEPMIFVDVDAAGTSSGNNWTDAMPTFQEALDCALSGHEVWLAEGTYGSTAASDGYAFTIDRDLSIYGGFSGDEELRAERDPLLFQSIVTVFGSDEVSYTNLRIEGASSVTVDGLGFDSEKDIASDSLIAAEDVELDVSNVYLTEGSLYLDYFLVHDTRLSISDTVMHAIFDQDDYEAWGFGYPLFVSTSGANTINLVRSEFSGLLCAHEGVALTACFYGNSDTSLNVVESRFSDFAIGTSASLFQIGGKVSIQRSSFSNITDVGSAVSTIFSADDVEVRDSVFVGADTGIGYTQGAFNVSNVTFIGRPNPKERLIHGSGTIQVDNSIFLGELGLIEGDVTFSHCIIEGAYDDSEGTWMVSAVDGGYNLDADDVGPLLVDADGADNILGTPDDDVSLLSTSSAIDAGKNAATPSTLDFAGAPRIVNGDVDPEVVIDIGAYEYQ